MGEKEYREWVGGFEAAYENLLSVLARLHQPMSQAETEALARGWKKSYATFYARLLEVREEARVLCASYLRDKDGWLDPRRMEKKFAGESSLDPKNRLKRFFSTKRK